MPGPAVALLPAVEKQLGLQVARERRSLEFVVIEEAGSSAAQTR
jgi:hypothetical protein